MKRQATGWEKILAKYISDKRLVSRIRQTNQFKHGQKNFNCYFKEDTLMANKHVKRCTTSLLTGEIQIKTTLRYHINPLE